MRRKRSASDKVHKKRACVAVTEGAAKKNCLVALAHQDSEKYLLEF